jgi:hypothetical protein
MGPKGPAPFSARRVTSDPVVGGSGGRLPSPEDPPPAGGGRRASRHFLAEPRIERGRRDGVEARQPLEGVTRRADLLG